MLGGHPHDPGGDRDLHRGLDSDPFNDPSAHAVREEKGREDCTLSLGGDVAAGEDGVAAKVFLTNLVEGDEYVAVRYGGVGRKTPLREELNRLEEAPDLAPDA